MIKGQEHKQHTGLKRYITLSIHYSSIRFFFSEVYYRKK